MHMVKKECIQDLIHYSTVLGLFYYRDTHAVAEQDNQLMLAAAKICLMIFDETLKAKAKLGNYLREKCYLAHYQQVSFKYFVISCLFSKLASKVSEIQTTV